MLEICEKSLLARANDFYEYFRNILETVRSTLSRKIQMFLRLCRCCCRLVSKNDGSVVPSEQNFMNEFLGYTYAPKNSVLIYAWTIEFEN